MTCTLFGQTWWWDANYSDKIDWRCSQCRAKLTKMIYTIITQRCGFMIKVGDVVRCINDHTMEEFLTLGNQYIILKVHESYSGLENGVTIICDNGRADYALARRFRKVDDDNDRTS